MLTYNYKSLFSSWGTQYPISLMMTVLYCLKNVPLKAGSGGEPDIRVQGWLWQNSIGWAGPSSGDLSGSHGVTA